MGLSITTTPAQIAIETIPGGLDMHTRNAQLELTQKQPKINITTEQPRILIDQYECFAEEGLKNNTDFMDEQAQRGYQQLVEYIGRVAENGDAMAKIGRKANIMIDIAKRDSITEHEFGMGTMPKARPKIDVAGGTVKLEPEERNNIGEINGVSGTYTPAEIDFNFTPTKINVKVVSYGSIDIRYTGNNVDTYI